MTQFATKILRNPQKYICKKSIVKKIEYVYAQHAMVFDTWQNELFVTISKCEHIGCTLCLIEWVITSLNENLYPKCPKCLQCELQEKDIITLLENLFRASTNYFETEEKQQWLRNIIEFARKNHLKMLVTEIHRIKQFQKSGRIHPSYYKQQMNKQPLPITRAYAFNDVKNGDISTTVSVVNSTSRNTVSSTDGCL